MRYGAVSDVAARSRMIRAMSSPPAAMPPFFWPLTEGELPPGRPSPDVEILGHDGGTFLAVSADGSVVSVEPGLVVHSGS